MSFITLKCKNCGSQMTLNTESHSATCTHCGSTFLLADVLDEQDIKITESTTGKDIERKMSAGDEIKKGETCIFQANYEEAEKHFKKAIEYDDKNFRAYLGIVKAKTQNLNVIPENDDYLEYAKCAINFAGFEDEVYVKSELAKIELLKREDFRQKKAKRAKARHEEYKRNKKREINRFFTKITIVIAVIFVVGILLANFLFGKDKGWEKLNSRPIEVSTTMQFVEALNSAENMNKTINIKADLDFERSSISPIGTASKPFSGKINGNNHTIKNLQITITDSGAYNYYGLFGCLANATVSDLTLENIEISALTSSAVSSSNSYGILAGTATNSTIKNVKVTGEACEISVANNNFSSLYIGGLVGKINAGTKITNAAVNTAITTTMDTDSPDDYMYIGGIAGYVDKSYITNSFYNGSVDNDVTPISFINNPHAYIYIAGIAGYVNNENVDTSTFIEKNISTASISTFTWNTSYSTTYIGGIAAHGANLNVSAENYFYVDGSNIYINGILTIISDLADYSMSDLFTHFTTSTEVIGSKLTEFFPSKTWTVLGMTVELKK
jgi:tetratricopeptide (TPR) repeat protein